jgi:hypothetical protein
LRAWSIEQVRVGVQRGGDVGVAELPGHEGDVDALCDQQRGVGVTKVMKA